MILYGTGAFGLGLSARVEMKECDEVVCALPFATSSST